MSRTDKNEEVLERADEKKSLPHTVKKENQKRHCFNILSGLWKAKETETQKIPNVRKYKCERQ